MYIQNSTYKQAVCGKSFNRLKMVCLVFLLTILSACQHQSATKQTPKVRQDTATHLPQAQPQSAEDRTAAMQAGNMAKIKQDKYLSAFLFSGFEETPPKAPEANKPATPQPLAVENEPASIETSHLVSVEVWSIILGEEKITLLAKAQKLGATQLPPPNEWHKWKMAMGGLDTSWINRDTLEGTDNLRNETKKTILFIAPPDFAKFKNGDHIIVEISNSGGVHTARYLKQTN